MSFTGVRPESTDEDLGVLIEHYLGRIEHSLSTLMLVHFGPLAEVSKPLLAGFPLIELNVCYQRRLQYLEAR